MHSGIFVLVAVSFVLPQELRIIPALLYLGVGITATVFVFMLALKIYPTTTGVLMGIGTLIPCIGLLILLMVNGRATSILKAAGLRVGLLGADVSKI